MGLDQRAIFLEKTELQHVHFQEQQKSIFSAHLGLPLL